MIVRSPRPTSHFSTFSNAVIRDSRLSYRARGILLDILSRPDNWTVSAESLAKTGKEGRDAVLKALNELRAIGYLVTTKTQGANGKFTTTSIIYDLPKDDLTLEPTPEKPSPEKPKSDNQGSLEVLMKNDLEEKNFPPLVTLGQGEAIKLANLLADKIAENGSKRPTVTEAWVTDMSRLMKIDGRTFDQIKSAIEWCQDDTFWRSNILSPGKLRKQYDSLRLRAMGQKSKPKGQAFLEQFRNERKALN